MADVPPKLFFRIGEVAGLVGVEPHVLRYWEREFRSIRPTKSAKGQRVYSRKDVENLLRVRDLLYRDGFTIAGAKKKMQGGAVEPEAVEELAPTSVAPSSLPASGVSIATVSSIAAVGLSVERSYQDSALSTMTDASEAERNPRVREKLTALRAEVEAFLTELSKGR